MKKFFVILVLLFLAGGIAAVWEFVCDFAYIFFKAFVEILPFLDLEQVILCKIVTILIVQILCGLGFIISRKTELKIGKFVSVIIDAIATLLIFIA